MKMKDYGNKIRILLHCSKHRVVEISLFARSTLEVASSPEDLVVDRGDGVLRGRGRVRKPCFPDKLRPAWASA